jgi:hypothetical protein
MADKYKMYIGGEWVCHPCPISDVAEITDKERRC